MFYKTNLDYGPLNRLKELSDNKSIEISEMTEFQQAFLCGLIKDKSPQKILELGVSGGGTTATILECLKENNCKSEMYSVDWLDYYYLDKNKPAGYFARDYMEEIAGTTEHKFLLGKSIPYFLDDIGEGIDCLILDTCHSLPGELMDFIVCLPYLADGCLVILHDVAENILNVNPGHEHDIATKLLFASVSAKKYYMTEEDPNLTDAKISNIGAFVVDSNTRNNIESVIMALSSTWNYTIDSQDYVKYASVVEKYYSDEIYKLFKRVYRAQDLRDVKKFVEYMYPFGMEYLAERWKKCNDVYLYGAGYISSHFQRFAEYNNLPLKGIVVSDDQEIRNRVHNGYKVYSLSEIEQEKAYIILALDKKYWPDVCKSLSEHQNIQII